MKLRTARKMDQHPPHAYPNKRADKRVWWTVYNVDQLQRAEMRLRRAWQRRNPSVDGNRKVDPDFFAMNRVESRRIRQAVICRLKREGKWPR